MRTSSDQAGAHADLTTSFAFAPNEAGAVDGLLRNVEVVLPVGFAGYPAAVKTCTPLQLQLEECPVDSQIGTIEVVLRLAPGVTDMIATRCTTWCRRRMRRPCSVFRGGHQISGNIVVSVGPDYRVHATVDERVHGHRTHASVADGVGRARPTRATTNERGNKYHCEQFTERGKWKRYAKAAASADENPVPFLVNPTQCTTEPLEAELERRIVGRRKAADSDGDRRPVHRLRIAEVRADDRGPARTDAGDDPDGLRGRSEGPADRRRGRPRDGRSPGRGREDAGGCRALPVGRERARSVHRSADRARQRTARWNARTRRSWARCRWSRRR